MKDNGNRLKIVVVIVTILAGYVGTYFTTASSMRTEIALIKQKSNLETEYLKKRIAKLEAANPEKLEGRVTAMQKELDKIASNFKIIKELLQ